MEHIAKAFDEWYRDFGELFPEEFGRIDMYDAFRAGYEAGWKAGRAGEQSLG
jgi:hypothetical protein